MPYKKIEVFGKEIALGQAFPIDVIVEYDAAFNRLIIKKPSGQVFVQLQPRDQIKK
jgi:hypothetical protein